MGIRFSPGCADCGCPSGCLISPAPTPGATLYVTWRVRQFGSGPSGSGPIVTASYTLAPATPSSTTNWGNTGVIAYQLNCDDMTLWHGAQPNIALNASRGVITCTTSPWQVHFLAHDAATMPSVLS